MSVLRETKRRGLRVIVIVLDPASFGGAGDALRLEMKAGIIPVSAAGDVWTLQANAPTHRPVAATPAEDRQCRSTLQRIVAALRREQCS